MILKIDPRPSASIRVHPRPSASQTKFARVQTGEHRAGARPRDSMALVHRSLSGPLRYQARGSSGFFLPLCWLKSRQKAIQSEEGAKGAK